MKNIQIFIIFLIILSPLFSQKHAGKWALGCGGCQPPNDGGATLDVTQDSAVVSLANRNMTMLTNASICDKNGDFLFYTNSYWIANRDNDTMMNGSNLYHSNSALGYLTQGGTELQGAIILPVPNDTNQYYLFHQTFSNYNNTYTPNTLVMNKVDMQQDSGRGAVVIKNIIMSKKEQRLFSHGQMTACKHANGVYWWLLLPQHQGQYYYRFLITHHDIIGPDSQAVAWGTTPFVNGDIAQSVFSPDGTKYACYIWTNSNYGRLLVFDFDRCTGLLSNKKEIGIADNGGAMGVWSGCAFSPNSRFIYISDFLHVHQYDTQAPNLALSDSLLMTYDGFLGPGQTNFGSALLAENGSIYFCTSGGTHYLHQIKHPDSLGMKCEPIQRAVDFLKGGMGLPNYPNYNLGAISQPCDTVTSAVSTIPSKNVFTLYPNPATNEVILSLSEMPQTDKTVNIYNSFGQLIYQSDWKQDNLLHKIDTHTFSNGIYFVNVIEQGNIIHQGKVIISH